MYYIYWGFTLLLSRSKVLCARLFRCSVYSVPYTIYSTPGMAVCLPLFYILYSIYSYYSSKSITYILSFWTSLNGPTNNFEYSKRKKSKKIYLFNILFSYTLNQKVISIHILCFIYSAPNSSLFIYSVLYALFRMLRYVEPNSP